MDTPAKLVDTVIVRLSHLGTLTSRSMFGGYGICQNKIMFALVSDGKFYLRADDELEPQFVDHAMDQLVYMNRGIPILMRYYHVHLSLWENEPQLTVFAKSSLMAAITDKQGKEDHKSVRLKELPNITLSIERLLWRVGIFDKENLFKIGAVQAFLMIKTISHSLSVNILFALAGAIEGCHSAALNKEVRCLLLDAIK